MPDKWFAKSIFQTQIDGGFDIILTTNVPCHLWLFWTDKVPWTHRTSAVHRGLNVPWDAYWCFVSWHLIDQDEAGDTYTHTFRWLGWQVCQTKYFRFHGDIAGVTSPSDSPIFHKHYPGFIGEGFFYFPVVEPKDKGFNVPIGSFTATALKSGTPTKWQLWIWHEIVGAYPYDLWIEEAYQDPSESWRPYDDQTGHILAYHRISVAEMDAYPDQWHLHTPSLTGALPLTEGTHYCLIASGTWSDYKTGSTDIPPGEYRAWQAQSNDPTARNFIGSAGGSYPHTLIT